MALAISIADLADGAAHGPLFDCEDGIREPVVVIELVGRPDPATLARALSRARHRDRLLVGVADGFSEALAELMDALDLTVLGPVGAASRECVSVADPEAHVYDLIAVARSRPQASLTLGRVLRLTSELAVPAALDVESYAYSTLLGGGEFAAWLADRGPLPPPAEVEQPVLIERLEDHLVITLNRPERRNAYGRLLRDALVAALEVAVRDQDVRRVVLRGAGPVFCSGGDLAEFGTAPDLTTAHLIRTRAGAARLIHALGRRVEVRMHGTCVGAGVELPSFAHRIVADPATTFRLPELAMGLIPGAGGTVGLPRRIGRWRTLHLLLSGIAIDASTALAWGLVDELAPARPESGVSHQRGLR